MEKIFIEYRMVQEVKKIDCAFKKAFRFEIVFVVVTSLSISCNAL